MIDTNIMISLLFKTDKSERAREILEASNGPVTTLSILEEVAYVGLSLIYGCRGFKLRDELRKKLTSEAKVFLDRVKSFVAEFRIRLLRMPEDIDLLMDSIVAYRLLPNDAAIVATCRHYGITKIATFDSDFNRVAFMQVEG